MALRAGYYGLKRKLIDKLTSISGSYDTTISGIQSNISALETKTTKATVSSGITLSEGVEAQQADQYNIRTIGDLVIISIILKGIVANQSTWFDVGVVADSIVPDNVYIGIASVNSKTDKLDCLLFNNNKSLKIRDNSAAITATDVVYIYLCYPKGTVSRSLDAQTPEDEPLLIKKTTRKKTTKTEEEE